MSHNPQSPSRPLPSSRLARGLAALWRQRWIRVIAWGLGGFYFAFFVLALVLRYAVLPNVDNYRGDIQSALGRALQLPVTIQRIEADWQGWRPRLTLQGLEIRDRQQRQALSFNQVQAVLGWSSALLLEPHLYRLEIQAPQLAVRRDREGRLFVAGLEVKTQANEPGLAEWVLRQRQVVVKDAAITWTDEQRAAPPLDLTQLNFNLQNSGSRHRFGLTAQPPQKLASSLDLRGDLHGSDLSDPAAWSGQLYADLDYADLAVWRTWIDYPVELPRGSGGVRLWLDLAKGQATGATADLSLRDLAVRLAPDLPMLDLARLQGRLQAKRLEDGFDLSTRALSLATAEGVHILPHDTRLRWQAKSGEFSTNVLDLGQLARVAELLPLPPEVRQGLARHKPEGRLKDFHLDWNGRQRPFEHYQAKGQLESLAWVGEGAIPGAEGISGAIDGNEKGGRIDLFVKDGAVDLPAVFAESRVPLTQLDAQMSWKRNGADYEVSIDKAAFRNGDAEGTAKGIYRSSGGSLGSIDLDARLVRGQASAVWRYMPKVTHADVITWLKASLISGRGENVSLKLKGPLDRFPFADGSGTFLIKGRIHDGVLAYAPGWPRIDGIAGELLFDKARMLITAQHATSMGAVLSGVSAELPNLDSHDPVLAVNGKAKGETAGFLRFIEASPVGGFIDHATADMSTTGSGELDLKLGLTLNHINDTKIAGTYRFDGNRVIVDAGAPPLDDVRGKLDFSDKGVSARDLRARILGGPASADIKTQADGVIAVDARGEVTAAQLRVQPWLSWIAPIFDNVSGSTRWDGTVRIRKRSPEVRISSDLRGISSSLPEPFNKPATEARAFVVEHKQPDARVLPGVAPKRGASVPSAGNRDLLDVSLARALRVQLLRNYEGGRSSVERGLIAVGSTALGPLRLPDHGTLLSLSIPKLDLDLWRRLLDSGRSDKGSDKSGGKTESDSIGLNQIDLRADLAQAFGRNLHDLRVTGNLRNEHWLADVKSREVAGRFDWLGTGKGKLTGRISQFSVPEGNPSSTPATPETGGEELPALDLTFDRFVLGGKDFGELRLMAENRAGTWFANLNAQSEDASLSGEGHWRPAVTGSAGSETQFDFKLKARSIEHLLNRMGYPNTVRRGNASLEGKLAWNGPPQAFDYPTLSGSLKVSAKDGQFNKLEPGVGRLLGIVSLQSLPRRISLDFRDVFSEGFAFDSIEGQAQIAKGVLDTRDLEINGPAARVGMQGTVDLVHETQNLRVRVQPALGETVTTGILLANPAVGLAYWVGNKLFGRPLDQIFAFEYAVTGPWADPQVNKVGGGVPKESK